MADYAALIAAEDLPADYAPGIELVLRPLAAAIAARYAGVPLVAGINGPQGSGKSTAAAFLAAILGREHALRTAVLSLDDLYLGRAERQALAARVHPLFVTRGVPGTHDVALGIAVLDALKAGVAATLPRFDKRRDDRSPAALCEPVDVVLFEGWCVGAGPQPVSALAVPVNALEAVEDPDGVWRGHANAALAGDYAALFARLDLLIALQPPGFACVAGWRRLQEAKLHAVRGKGMSDDAIDRFVMHFERLTRHLLAAPQRADFVVAIDAGHRLTALSAR